MKQNCLWQSKAKAMLHPAAAGKLTGAFWPSFYEKLLICNKSCLSTTSFSSLVDYQPKKSCCQTNQTKQWFIVFSGRRTDVENDTGLIGCLQRSCICFRFSTNYCLLLERTYGGRQESHRKEGHIVLLAFFLSKIKGKEGWILPTMVERSSKDNTTSHLLCSS